MDDTAAKLRRAADNAGVQIRSRGFSAQGDMLTHQATLRGTDRLVYTWCSAEGLTEDIRTDGRPVVKVTDYLVACATRYAEQYDQDAVDLRSQAARVLAAGEPVGSYGVVRWSSSAALAMKALSEFDYLAALGHTVRVVPVDAA